MRTVFLAFALASASMTVGNVGSAASADPPSRGTQCPSNPTTTGTMDPAVSTNGMMESCGRMMSQMMDVAPQQPDQPPQHHDDMN